MPPSSLLTKVLEGEYSCLIKLPTVFHVSSLDMCMSWGFNLAGFSSYASSRLSRYSN